MTNNKKAWQIFLFWFWFTIILGTLAYAGYRNDTYWELEVARFEGNAVYINLVGILWISVLALFSSLVSVLTLEILEGKYRKS